MKSLSIVLILLAACDLARAKEVPLPRAKPVSAAHSPPQAAEVLPLHDAEAWPSDCVLRLAEIARFVHQPSVNGPGQCGASDVVRLEAIIMPNSALVSVMPAATLRCPIAEAVAQWVRNDLGSAMAELESAPAAIKAETAKRDAQLAKAEVERLSAEAAKLNSTLERLQTEKNEARMMEFVVDGAIIILIVLIAIISSILFINRRKAIGGKVDEVGPEAKLSGMIGDSPVVETQRASDGAASEPAKASDTILTSPEPAQFLPNSIAPKSQNGSGASDAISASEERVTLPI